MQNDVKQVDREAAIVYWGNDNPPLELQRIMTAHRIAAEAKSAKLSIATIDRQAAEIAALQARVAELEGVVRWYGDAAANCRKFGTEGDNARRALDGDGGERANTALLMRDPSICQQ